MNEGNIQLYLPKSHNTCKIDFNLKSHIGSKDKVLNIFNNDEDKKLLTKQEINKALAYFSELENRIAVNGKKGDGILTQSDLYEIIRTEKKFKDLLEQSNNEDELVQNLQNTILLLSELSEISADNEIDLLFYSDRGIEYMDRRAGCCYGKALDNYGTVSKKAVDGKVVNIVKKADGDGYVTSDTGEKINDKDFVAKCLGYKTTRCLSNLFKKSYYFVTDRNIKRGKIWDANSSSFVADSSIYKNDIKSQ